MTIYIAVAKNTSRSCSNCAFKKKSEAELFVSLLPHEYLPEIFVAPLFNSLDQAKKDLPKQALAKLKEQKKALKNQVKRINLQCQNIDGEIASVKLKI